MFPYKFDHHFLLDIHSPSSLIRSFQGKQYLAHAPNYTAFACGLLRGALSNLGIHSVVTAEIAVMPAVKFQIQIQQKVWIQN